MKTLVDPMQILPGTSRQTPFGIALIESIDPELEQVRITCPGYGNHAICSAGLIGGAFAEVAAS